MVKKVQKIVGTIVVASVSVCNLHAEASTTSVLQDDSVAASRNLKEVRITGKATARRLQQQAYPISVIDMKKVYNASGSLNRMLDHVASVRVREDGGVGSNYNFSINGFSGNQVKFFLDGIPMDNFGSAFNLANIAANMVDRVEVYKGVLPVFLGGDALGGAVNVVTRRNANYLDASYSIGSFNTHKVSLNGAYTDPTSGFTARVNAFYNYSDNDYKVLAPVVDLEKGRKLGDQWVKRFHDGYESMGVRFETGLTGRSWADYLLVGVIAAGNWKDQQTGATMDAVYGGVKTKSHTFIPSIRYKKTDIIDGLSLSLYGTYNMVDDYNTDTLSQHFNWLGQWVAANPGEAYYTDAKIKRREWQALANVDYVIDAHTSLTLNNTFTSLRRKSHDAVYPDKDQNLNPLTLTKNVLGLGYQIRYDRWNATVFGKYYNQHSSSYKMSGLFTQNYGWDIQKNDKSKFGYGAMGTWFILPSLQVKVSYELAYRLPEAVEIFGDGLIQQSNPDLNPEKSHNFNAGMIFDHYLGDHHLYAEGNFIYRNTSDFILKGVSVTANPTTSYKNIGKVLTRGFETNLRYDYKQLLHAGASLTYQSIIDNQEYTQNGLSSVGGSQFPNANYKMKLPNIPYFFANGNLGFGFNDVLLKGTRLTLDYTLNYVHDYYLAAYGMGEPKTKNNIPEQLSHDVSLGYTLADGRYSVMFECTNIGDTKLYDNYRLQKPGRAFNVKFRYYISK